MVIAATLIAFIVSKINEAGGKNIASANGGNITTGDGSTLAAQG